MFIIQFKLRLNSSQDSFEFFNLLQFHQNQRQFSPHLVFMETYVYFQKEQLLLIMLIILYPSLGDLTTHITVIKTKVMTIHITAPATIPMRTNITNSIRRMKQKLMVSRLERAIKKIQDFESTESKSAAPRCIW